MCSSYNSSSDSSLDGILQARESLKSVSEKRKQSLSMFEELNSTTKFAKNEIFQDDWDVSETINSLNSRIVDLEYQHGTLICENDKLKHDLHENVTKFKLESAEKDQTISSLVSQLQETRILLEKSQNALSSRENLRKSDSRGDFEDYATLKTKFKKIEAEFASFKAKYADFLLILEENHDLKQTNQSLQRHISSLTQLNQDKNDQIHVLEGIISNTSREMIEDSTQFPQISCTCQSPLNNIKKEYSVKRLEELQRSNDELKNVVNDQNFRNELLKQQRDSFRAILDKLEETNSYNNEEYRELLAAMSPIENGGDDTWSYDLGLSVEPESYFTEIGGGELTKNETSNNFDVLKERNSMLTGELNARGSDVEVECFELSDGTPPLMELAVDDLKEKLMHEKNLLQEFKRSVCLLTGYQIDVGDGKASVRMAGKDVPKIGLEGILVFEVVLVVIGGV